MTSQGQPEAGRALQSTGWELLCAVRMIPAKSGCSFCLPTFTLLSELMEHLYSTTKNLIQRGHRTSLRSHSRNARIHSKSELGSSRSPVCGCVHSGSENQQRPED